VYDCYALERECFGFMTNYDVVVDILRKSKKALSVMDICLQSVVRGERIPVYRARQLLRIMSARGRTVRFLEVDGSKHEYKYSLSKDVSRA